MQTTAYATLRDRVITLAARISAAEYQFLVCLRALERESRLVDCTFPQWVSIYCNMDIKKAYEMVRVARALEHLPKLSQAMERGQLSWSKIRIVTRMATAQTDERYVDYALYTSVHQLERLVQTHRRVSNCEAEEQIRKRYFQIVPDSDGLFTVRGKLTADEAAILQKALDAAYVAGADNRPDALMHIATAAIDRLATGDNAVLHVASHHDIGRLNSELDSAIFHNRILHDEMHSGEAHNDEGDDAEVDTHRGEVMRSDVMHNVMHRDRTCGGTRGDDAILHGVNHCASGGAHHAGCGEAHGTNVHPSGHVCGDNCRYDVEGFAIAQTTADRLCCGIHAGRTINVPQRRLLMRRQGNRCAHPFCTNRLWLQGHHIVFWRDGGRTTVDNTVLICGKHHRLLHEGQHSIRRENGQVVYRDARGDIIRNPGPPPVVASDDRDLATTVPATTDTSGYCRSHGERLNMDFAMDRILK